MKPPVPMRPEVEVQQTVAGARKLAKGEEFTEALQLMVRAFEGLRRALRAGLCLFCGCLGSALFCDRRLFLPAPAKRLGCELHGFVADVADRSAVEVVEIGRASCRERV